MASSEQVSVLLSFLSETGPLVEAQKQLNDFLETLQVGARLDVGARFADWFLDVPAKISEATRAGIEYAETTKNMAAQTRTTASSFQVLSLLATQNGVEVGKLVTVVQKMSTAAEDAVNGNTKFAQTFERLHINAQEFSALPVPAQLEALAKAGEEAHWSTQALDDIFQILGTKSGPQWIAVLHELAEKGFKRVSEEAVATGDVLDDKLTAALARIGEQHKATAQAWNVAMAEMANAVSPLLRALDFASDKFAILTQKAAQAADGHLGAATKGMGLMVGGGAGTLLQLLGAGTDDRPIGPDLAGMVGKGIGMFDPAFGRAVGGLLGANDGAKVDPGKSNGGAQKSAETQAKEAAAENKKSADWEKSMDDDIEAAVKAQQKLNEERQKADIASEAADWADIEAAEREKQKQQLAQQEFALETQIKAAEDAGNQAKADGLKLDLERLKNSQMDKGLLDARIALLKEEYTTKRTLTAIEAQETADEAQKGVLEKQRQEISKNAGLDAAARRAQLLQNTQQYRAVLTDILALEKQRMALTNNPEEIAKLRAKIVELQAELSNSGKTEKKTDQTPEQQSKKNFDNIGDPSKNFSSATGAVTAGLQDSISKMPTLFDQIHTSVKGISQDLSGGLASGMMGIINHAETARQAFAKIGESIEQSMLSAITSFISQLIVAQVEALILDVLTGGASAEGGGASGGAGVISKLLGFSDGGLTGDAPVGVVHKNEWVAPSWMLSHPVAGGVISALENMRNGASSLSQLSDVTHASLASRAVSRPGSFGASPSATQSPSGGRMNVTFVDDRQSALTAMRRSQGKQTVVNIMRNGRGEFFA